MWQGLLNTRKHILPSTAQLGEIMSKLEETQSEILQTLSRMERMLDNSQKFTPSHLSAAHTPCFTNTPPVHPVDYLLDTTVSRTNSLHTTSEVSISPVFEPALTSAQRDPLPLDHIFANNPLPSSKITDELQSVKNILKRQRTASSKPSTLAQMLAKEAFFGASIMCKCTPSGTRNLPALPKAEMFQIKRIVFNAFPHLFPTAEAFEVEWKKKCWVAIEQACGRLRRNHYLGSH